MPGRRGGAAGLTRCRYYYAVVECDSDRTAKHIYDNCDGAEYETTANFFDLRFVPDETSFDDDAPRDVCSQDPAEYTPADFVTDVGPAAGCARDHG